MTLERREKFHEVIKLSQQEQSMWIENQEVFHMLSWIQDQTKKRHVGMALVLVVAMLTIAGCSGSAYEKLLKAEAKTEAAASGITTTRVMMENQLDTAGMTQEQLKMANYIKNVTYEGTMRFDNALGQFVSDNFLSMGGIGFDFGLYGLQDKTYAKLSVMKKYMDVSDLMSSQIATQTESKMFSENTMAELGAIWSNLANKDNVVRSGSALLKTDAGDIKTTRYRIEADTAEVKSALVASMSLIFKELSTQSSASDLEAMAGQFETLEIDAVILTTDVASSGYVVRDLIEVDYRVEEMVTKIKIEVIHNKLDESIDLKMPDIRPELIYTSEELEREMPGALDDLFGTFGIQTK
jgi:hypothetical protein